MAEDRKEPQIRVVDRRWWARDDPTTSAQESSSLKPTYVEDLERQLADMRAQLQKVMADHRRAFDEFDDVKGRIRRDVAREVERGRRAVLAEVLEVLDNLDRAVAAAHDSLRAVAGSPSPADSGSAAFAALDTLTRGVELIRDHFLGKLQSFGVTRLAAVGVPFDPVRHEAITTTMIDDPSQNGVVVAVLAEGYAIGDEVLRPAAVVVGMKES